MAFSWRHHWSGVSVEAVSPARLTRHGQFQTSNNRTTFTCVLHCSRGLGRIRRELPFIPTHPLQKHYRLPDEKKPKSRSTTDLQLRADDAKVCCTNHGLEGWTFGPECVCTHRRGLVQAQIVSVLIFSLNLFIMKKALNRLKRRQRSTLCPFSILQ